ncbi:MAG TPA: outer membrane beta-barrel protein [Nitrospiraceae bacterium]|nr:outer membrane beta-barrel protein [Nitrospiraceae bacterium]
MTRHAVRIAILLVFCILPFEDLIVANPAYAEVNDLKPGQWSGGGGVGFLGNTPDGAVEFAFNGHADYFLARNFSVGPLAQYAGAGNDFLFGMSAQARYWWDIPNTKNLAKLVLQGGIGFVRAGIKDNDFGFANTYTSFLIPIGVGVDYTVSKQLAVTADFLLNFTSLGESFRVANREFDYHTNVMPALYFGVRF